MLKLKKTNQIKLNNSDKLLALYLTSKKEFIRSKETLDMLSFWIDSIWEKKPDIIRICGFVTDNPVKLIKLINKLKSKYRYREELLMDIYINFSKYILSAPEKPERIDNLLFYTEKAIGYSIANIIRKLDKKDLKPLYSSEEPSFNYLFIDSNVDFYTWFYSNLQENSLYTDMWEFFPVSKETYCKFINKEVKQ